MTTAHVISHTHWDREWFLLSDVTNEWLDDLFDRLFHVIDQQPQYRYILDGQTLMLEDYLTTHPEQQSHIQRYAEAGNLLIGPYYGQVDWRVVSEESLMRNLYFGILDAQSYGNLMPYGWLMDNFGHCSQAPQIHRLFGIQEVFVWRGPVFEDDAISSDFVWQGSDGSEVYANYLMSGYRNFYNLTDTTDFLDLRIDQLRDMLEPFTPHKQLIFLNGYDLDVFPEDPFQFLKDKQGFVRSTPETYAQEREIQKAQAHLSTPRIQGELYSGKYACVFPGSLSARTYLRIENSLVEQLLAFYLEPLQALLSGAGVDINFDRTESLWRDLLKTQLHDNIGGVGIDQIHDNMECVYRGVYDTTHTLIKDSLAYLPSVLDLQAGKYAFLPSPFEYETLWLNGHEKTYAVSSKGTGFYKIAQEYAVTEDEQEIETYSWENDFYTFEITKQGATLNGNPIGQFVLEKDAGDTYNADPEPFVETPKSIISSFKLLEEHKEYAKIALKREISQPDIRITSEEEIFLSTNPLLEWKVVLDSQGTDYRLRFTYETQDRQSDVFAKMPYDIYQRPRKDTNYFGENISNELRPVLLAAREIGAVSDFPFQGFVALSGGKTTKAMLAKGLREYEVDENGKIFMTLRRSVEWLAKSKLRTRIGDAGPYMYLPGARDERTTQFELAFVDIEAPVRSPEFLKWFYLFEYGALFFENTSFKGTQSAVKIWEEALPWSGIQTIEQGKRVIRLYNPFGESRELSKIYSGTDPFGHIQEQVQQVAPNKITHLLFELASEGSTPACTDVNIVDFPEWPVGEDHSIVDVVRLDEFREKIELFKQEQAKARQRLSEISEEEDALAYHQTKHTVIRLEREILELELSILLNELKANESNTEIHEKIRTVGKQLNLARRQRRTYDYILSVFEN